MDSTTSRRAKHFHHGRYFKDAGYHTCYIGKWHLDGHDYFGTGECPPEWDADYWFDGANYLSELTEKEISLWRNGLNSVEDLQANHIDETFTGRTASAIGRWIFCNSPRAPTNLS